MQPVSAMQASVNDKAQASTHTCTECQGSYEIAEKDREFLNDFAPTYDGKRFVIPLPTLCPTCRLRKRLNWRAELHLHQRTSDKSGRSILAQFSQESPRTVWSVEEWWEDDWDPLSYGVDFDFSRPFFEQIEELMQKVPVMALSLFSNENSDFINSASWCKNCYLLAGANHNEDCYYGNFVNRSKSCIDCSFVHNSELCYECIDCEQCYNLRYSQNCSNCSDSYFLFNCRGCKHCFGSVNLVEKEYCFLNEQLTKDEYERRIAAAELHRRNRLEEAAVFFEKRRPQYPHKHLIGEMNENVTGNGILRSRNAHHCFDVSDLEDCRYCSWFHQGKNCMDCYAWGFPVAECYECMEVGDNSYGDLFSTTIYNGSNLLYCYHCMNGTKNSFGSCGLRSNEYCILNKQYSKEEYEKLVARIIEHMQGTGEWGQFFPMNLCPLAYNESIAQDYFPLERAEAEKLGSWWGNETPSSPPSEKISLPETIGETDEDIVGKVLTCSETGKPYKITKQEYALYKQQNIPLPLKSFYPRHLHRLRKRNPRMLWDRQCAKCSKEMQTTYAPERKEIVYCEKCYLAEVY